MRDWFVRRSPADTAGVLSPPATAAVMLALLAVVALSAPDVSAPTAIAAAVRTIAERSQNGEGADADRPAGSPQRPPPTAAVTLAFGGDVHFEKWLRDDVAAAPRHALDGVAALLGDADLAVVNLETAVTERGTPAPKRHTFRAPTEGLTALSAAGVDVVSIANNHGMDYGVDGLIDTLRATRDARVAVVGGGRSGREAYRPLVRDIHGRRIAVIGATQVLDGNVMASWTAGPDTPGLASAKTDHDGLPRLLAAVRTAAQAADTVVVMVHWGQEQQTCPLPSQRQLATALRQAGADVIVGGHAHRLVGGGYLGDAVVHYGLGKLVFYAQDGPATDSGVFTVTIAPDDTMRIAWRPATLRAGVATGPTDSDAGTAAIDAWNELRSCTDLTATPVS